MKSLAILAILIGTVAGAVAQTAGAAGHWEGTIQFPNKQVKLSVDLAQNDKGAWIGTMAFPEQKIDFIELMNIVVKDESVSFKSMRWLVGIEGDLSPDGQSIKGDFLSAALRTVPVPVELRRISGPRVNAAAKSTPIAKELEGTWEGIAKLGASWENDDPRAGSSVAVRLKLAGGPGGLAVGALTKAAAEGDVPLSVVAQKGSSVRLELPSEGAVFVGELRGGELVGDWSQFDADPVPLTLKRSEHK